MTEETDKAADPDPDSNSQPLLEVTPIQLLGIMLKIVLKERITDEEVEKICSVYYETVQDWWGGE
jgi:hypothetical protein